jgi:hypothetical protein
MLATYSHLFFALLAGSAGFAYFRNKGNTVAEAGAYALMALLMLHSWTAQVALMAGWQRFHHFGLALLSIPAIRIIARHRGTLGSLLHAAKGFVRDHGLPSWTLAGGLVVLAALNISGIGLDWIGADPGFHPALAIENGSLFGEFNGAGSPALIVLNHAVIASAWQPGAAVIIANLSAWLVIALCTYALARRCAWPATAATVALLVVCMPRVVQQSLVLHSELLPAAAVLLALLALYRGVEQPRAHDLVMLPAAVAFSVSGGRICYLMPAIVTGLSLLVLNRRHHVRRWPNAVSVHGRAAVVALGAVLVFSQAGNVAFNLAHGKEWIGASALEEVAFNMDGIAGTVANAGRYIFQSLHFPEYLSLHGTLEAAHRNTFGALLGGKGAATPFELSRAVQDPWMWFGPVGFLLVLPALVYTLQRAPRRLKSTAAAMLAYFLAIALILAWRPQNVRQLTMFFTGSGFLIAFFLPPWRINRRGRLVLQLFSICMAGYTLLACT